MTRRYANAALWGLIFLVLMGGTGCGATRGTPIFLDTQGGFPYTPLQKRSVSAIADATLPSSGGFLRT